MSGEGLDLPTLCDEVSRIARQAARRILDFYRADFSVTQKDDRTPVTEADHAADAIIVPALQRLTPDIPVISEERAARITGAGPLRRFWLVDPLDGTREFIHHRDEFSVNIGLIESGAPLLGVIAAPVADAVYAAYVGGTASKRVGDGPKKTIAARLPPASGIVVASSRSHADKPAVEKYLSGFKVAGRKTLGSALKFCILAEGEADLYPRFGPTGEWDTAAGHCILKVAGGSVTSLLGTELTYCKPGFFNPDFIARGRV
ncbi:MAG: 3'(2'),5'-bisphosphate nucleotidase CysQ [Alphaproteobacteria bacterium]